jgi:hypothetical protein
MRVIILPGGRQNKRERTALHQLTGNMADMWDMRYNTSMAMFGERL